MKQRLLLLVTATGLFTCCQQQHQEKVPEHAIEPHHTTPATSCYAYTQNNDTVQLQLTTTDTLTTGHLVYNLYEKDRNKGTIQGSFRGDTLFARYTFQSEGATSVREVAFLRQGDSLREGFGEMSEQQGQLQFKNHGQLDFSGLQLAQVPCADSAEFSVTGTVTDIAPGKDGYTARIRGTDSKSYSAVISVVNMMGTGNYQQLSAGDQVTLYGDSMQLGDIVSIKVSRIEK